MPSKLTFVCRRRRGGKTEKNEEEQEEEGRMVRKRASEVQEPPVLLANSCCKSKVKMVLAKRTLAFCSLLFFGFQGQILVVSVLFALLKPYFFCLFVFI